MIATFDRSGIRFQYPENWSLDLDEDTTDGTDDAEEVGWTALVQSPELAFVLVSLRPGGETPETLADETLAALREEYPELEDTDVVESFLGVPAIGHDIDFFTLDTSISCRTRCIDTPTGTLLILRQVSEYDREKNELVLDAICQSLKFQDD